MFYRDSGWPSSLTAPTSTPPPARSASTSTTSSCAQFMRRGKLLRAFYYTALLEYEEYSPIRPLVDWLNYNGYAMVTKPAKEFTDPRPPQGQGQHGHRAGRRRHGDGPHVDHIVLFSGDGDFRPLVEILQRSGVRVSVVSTIRSSPPMIADELRRQCDNSSSSTSCAKSSAARRAASRPRPPSSPPTRTNDAPEPPTPLAARGSWPTALANALRHPDWWNGAVPSFGDASGSPPRPSASPPASPAPTAPWAPLHRRLRGRAPLRHAQAASASPTAASPPSPTTASSSPIASSPMPVRCVPPANKPTPAEIATCRAFLAARLAALPRLRAVVLPRPHRSRDALSAPSATASPSHPFAHAARHDLGGPRRLRQLPLLALQHQHRPPERPPCSRPSLPTLRAQLDDIEAPVPFA